MGWKRCSQSGGTSASLFIKPPWQKKPTTCSPLGLPLVSSCTMSPNSDSHSSHKFSPQDNKRCLTPWTLLSATTLMSSYTIWADRNMRQGGEKREGDCNVMCLETCQPLTKQASVFSWWSMATSFFLKTPAIKSPNKQMRIGRYQS